MTSMTTGSEAVSLPQPTAEGPISKKRKRKGKGKGGKNKGKGKEDGEEKGKGKEVAIKEAANTGPDGQHRDKAQGPARLASLPTDSSSLSFPVTTSAKDHIHTPHHSTIVETGRPATTVEASEPPVPTPGDMPASTRGMTTLCKP